MGGNGNDSLRVGKEWEQESHSRTPLHYTLLTYSFGSIDKIPITCADEFQRVSGISTELEYNLLLKLGQRHLHGSCSIR